ncbi:cyclin-dependent kinase 11B-like [Thunnus thynnus]|uniref:cyclin-dependent kinase 11B-like n=1 Tax=Thunnus thynnus TaxID=8237 RepID=UPI003527C208
MFPSLSHQHNSRKNTSRQKVKIRNRAAVCDVLQHSDSDGVLLGETRSLQPATSSSTLGESEAERPAEEEEEEGEGRGKESLQRLSCSEEEEEEEEEEGRLSLQAAEDSDPDDILLEDDQVADFASSVLAAISCWHYRAQALLSTGVAMVTVRLSAASWVFFMCPPTRPPYSGSVTH